MRIGAFLVSMLLTATASAAPTFFLSPGNDPTGDLAFQAQLDGFAEEDFEEFRDELIYSMNIDGIVVSFAVPDGVPRALSAAFGQWGEYGTIWETALFSCPEVFFCGPSPASMVLYFSEPIAGFGTWIWEDDTSAFDSYQMFVNGVTSPSLDADPGATYGVEGFLGVTDPDGFTSLRIDTTSTGRSFALDHIQIARTLVPLPPALWLFGSAVLGLAVSARRGGCRTSSNR